MASTIEVLRAARALIATEDRWTTDAWARDLDGEKVRFDDERAVCWCLFGAVDRVGLERGGNGRAEAALLEAGDRRHSRTDLTRVNDTMGHEVVLEIIDDAIALAEKEQWS